MAPRRNRTVARANKPKPPIERIEVRNCASGPKPAICHADGPRNTVVYSGNFSSDNGIIDVEVREITAEPLFLSGGHRAGHTALLKGESKRPRQLPRPP